MKSKISIGIILALIPLHLTIIASIRSNRAEALPFELEAQKVKGSLNAPVFLVVFSDFTCPHCKDISNTLNQLDKEFEGKVQIRFKHYPLGSEASFSWKAAEASECAAVQGRFWPFHDFLFANPAEWATKENPQSQFESYATQIQGLDIHQFSRCVESRETKDRVSQNKLEGSSNHVRSVPAVLLNGREIVKKRDYASLKQKLSGFLLKGESE